MKSIRLPERGKRFLQTEGLPERGPLLVTFGGPDFLKEIQKGGRSYYVLGSDEGTAIAAAAGSGEVWSIDLEDEPMDRFINSSPEAFVESLKAYVRKGPELSVVSDDDAPQVVESLRKEITAIDSRAFDDKEDWWSVILEQTEQELL